MIIMHSTYMFATFKKVGKLTVYKYITNICKLLYVNYLNYICYINLCMSAYSGKIILAKRVQGFATSFINRIITTLFKEHRNHIIRASRNSQQKFQIHGRVL